MKLKYKTNVFRWKNPEREKFFFLTSKTFDSGDWLLFLDWGGDIVTTGTGGLFVVDKSSILVGTVELLFQNSDSLRLDLKCCVRGETRDKTDDRRRVVTSQDPGKNISLKTLNNKMRENFLTLGILGNQIYIDEIRVSLYFPIYRNNRLRWV